MNDLIQICEELYGNVATVFHRFEDPDKVRQIFSGVYKNLAHIDFNDYHNGIYTTFNMESQRSEKGDNDMEASYGDKILKIAIKDMNKFMFMDFGQYRKYNRSAKEETFIREQLKKFGIDKYFNSDPDNHVTFSKTVERNKLFNKVAGVIYHGEHDGDCALIYDNKAVFPISISFDNGKSWEPFKEVIKGFSDEAKKSYRERFDAYKRGFNPSTQKDKLYQRNEIPAAIIKQAANRAYRHLNIWRNRSEVLNLDKLKIGKNIYYTIKKGKEERSGGLPNNATEKVIYTFYSNGEKICEIADTGSFRKTYYGLSLRPDNCAPILLLSMYYMKKKNWNFFDDFLKDGEDDTFEEDMIRAVNRKFKSNSFSIQSIGRMEGGRYPKNFKVVMKYYREGSDHLSVRTKTVALKGDSVEMNDSSNPGQTIRNMIGENEEQKLVNALKELRRMYVREFGLNKNAN